LPGELPEEVAVSGKGEIGESLVVRVDLFTYVHIHGDPHQRFVYTFIYRYIITYKIYITIK